MRTHSLYTLCRDRAVPGLLHNKQDILAVSSWATPYKRLKWLIHSKGLSFQKSLLRLDENAAGMRPLQNSWGCIIYLFLQPTILLRGHYDLHDNAVVDSWAPQISASSMSSFPRPLSIGYAVQLDIHKERQTVKPAIVVETIIPGILSILGDTLIFLPGAQEDKQMLINKYVEASGNWIWLMDIRSDWTFNERRLEQQPCKWKLLLGTENTWR